MIDGLFALMLLGGGVIFFLGLASLACVPLCAAYLYWERGVLRRAREASCRPRVSVLVPAYNEERTIALSVRSILASRYPDFEVIVVDDGSTDGTARALRDLRGIAGSDRLHCLWQPNGGKASALNRALAHADGDVVLFTDADTLFESRTIANAVSYMADPSVGAVGGNDTPLRPRGWLQSMLVVTSHIGTGFVRRALSVVNLLPIIPGNLGLVRTPVLRALGGFREVWGEDLELTLRLHANGVRVVYGASARVLAECPDRLGPLWRQRVRWARSYIKVVRMHRALLHPRGGAFAIYLGFLSIGMVLLPFVQLFTLAMLPFAIEAGVVTLEWLELVGFLGLISLFAIAAYAIQLDDAPHDYRYLPYLLLMVPLSQFYNAVMLHSIWAEWRAHAERWHKLERRDARTLD